MYEHYPDFGGRFQQGGSNMPAWLAPAIGAVGSIVGGALSGSGSGGTSDHEYWKQLYWKKRGITEMQDELGIHKTILAGGAGFNPQPARVGGSGIGEGIASAASRFADYMVQKEVSKSQTRLLNSQADYYEALAKNEIDKRGPVAAGQPDVPPDQPYAGDPKVRTVQKQRVATQTGDPSKEAGSAAAFQFVDIPGGGKQLVPSEAVSEAYEAEGELQMAMRSIKRLIERGVNVFTGMAGQHSQTIRNNRPPDPLPFGYEWRYDPYEDGYFPEKIGDEGPQTYRQKQLWYHPYGYGLRRGETYHPRPKGRSYR